MESTLAVLLQHFSIVNRFYFGGNKKTHLSSNEVRLKRKSRGEISARRGRWSSKRRHIFEFSAVGVGDRKELAGFQAILIELLEFLEEF
jgi:hypothetical protein